MPGFLDCYNLEKWGKWLVLDHKVALYAHELVITPVKNGFSDLTKEQVGRDRQGKALREGCHEREWARMSASSREKNNTKRNLARATTKYRAGHRQSLMDMSVKE